MHHVLRTCQTAVGSTLLHRVQQLMDPVAAESCLSRCCHTTRCFLAHQGVRSEDGEQSSEIAGSCNSDRCGSCSDEHTVFRALRCKDRSKHVSGQSCSIEYEVFDRCSGRGPFTLVFPKECQFANTFHTIHRLLGRPGMRATWAFRWALLVSIELRGAEHRQVAMPYATLLFGAKQALTADYVACGCSIHTTLAWVRHAVFSIHVHEMVTMRMCCTSACKCHCTCQS